MDSPPKRMTRARAAAKAGEPSVKTTKIVTAAAKARTTVRTSFTASTKSTAAKRKARSDDADEEEREATQMKKPRGRPKKAAEEEENAPIAKKISTAAVQATRTNLTPKLKTAELVKEESAPTKATRGRPKKVVAPPEREDEAPELIKKTSYGHAASAKAKTTTATSSKPPTKKIVKFQEPDKENVEPASKPREPATAGLRGRPARRGGAAAAKTVRSTTKASTSATGEKKPLSPRKVTQLSMFSRDESEDELALEKVSVKPMKKSPVKPPSKRPETIPVEIEPEADIMVNTAMFDPPDVASAIFTSPARRPQSPTRETMKSPAKRIAVPLPGSAFKLGGNDQTSQTPFKSNLLQSAAKRPHSPIKGFALPSAQKSQSSESVKKPSMLHSPAKRALPGYKPPPEPRQQELSTLDESPAMKPLVASTPTPATRPSAKLMMGDDMQETAEEELFNGPIEGPQFSGRLSALVPRHADPSLDEAMPVNEEEEEALKFADENQDLVPPEEEIAEIEECAVSEEQAAVADDTGNESEDPMAIDDIAAEMESSTELPPKETAKSENPVFHLREKDQDPCHDLTSTSDSEDDTLPFERITATPTIVGQKTPKSQSRRSPSKMSRRSTLGLGALADQLSSWSATSPVKTSSLATKEITKGDVQRPEFGNEITTGNNTNASTPIKDTYFEDQMVDRFDPPSTTGTPHEKVTELEEPVFDDGVIITDEDVALAQEANDMSLMDAKEDENTNNTRQSFDDSLSDASQEYGDENQMPIDPAMLGGEPEGPVTPVRPVNKAFHTTTKIPLKPADDGTPSPLKKRSFSASRASSKRPSRPLRSASVISYSPEKERRRSSRNFKVISEETEAADGPTTPAKADMWSNIGTPARTPRRDLDSGLLRGATVFVDVHTSEGADASGIFVELLTQMGARCVKNWSWNPSSPTNADANKVGITHVVFKDGSKRTLEKVREANGVVQCVGVSWVLDCERDNEWLEEAPYRIDTSSIPRGGARRRKSMEPTALANMNGTIVNSVSKSRRQTTDAATTTPNRRQSGVWIHTPSDVGGDEDEDDIEWSKLILTPVPKTPAPETIMRFAAETPSEFDEDEDEPVSPTKEQLLMRTCPPKAQKFAQLGAGILSKDKDEQVVQRLMAARRKSLQFAPKVGSPLAKMWR